MASSSRALCLFFCLLTSKFHFARLTLSCSPTTSVFTPRPLTPLHSPVLARSLPGPRPSSPGLARPRPAPPGLARPSHGLVSSNLTVKTAKREVYYFSQKNLATAGSERAGQNSLCKTLAFKTDGLDPTPSQSCGSARTLFRAPWN